MAKAAVVQASSTKSTGSAKGAKAKTPTADEVFEARVRAELEKREAAKNAAPVIVQPPKPPSRAEVEFNPQCIAAMVGSCKENEHVFAVVEGKIREAVFSGTRSGFTMNLSKVQGIEGIRKVHASYVFASIDAAKKGIEWAKALVAKPIVVTKADCGVWDEAKETHSGKLVCVHRVHTTYLPEPGQQIGFSIGHLEAIDAATGNATVHFKGEGMMDFNVQFRTDVYDVRCGTDPLTSQYAIRRVAAEAAAARSSDGDVDIFEVEAAKPTKGSKTKASAAPTPGVTTAKTPTRAELEAEATRLLKAGKKGSKTPAAAVVAVVEVAAKPSKEIVPATPSAPKGMKEQIAVAAEKAKAAKATKTVGKTGSKK